MTTFLVFAGSLMVLIGLHEAGHFFMARAFGVYIKEFAIGFGPKLFAFQGKETRYSLRLIPFGGYVRMAGEDSLEEDDTIPPERVLYAKRPYARALISLAGPLANLLLAFAITLIVTWSHAFPVLQVADVVAESPAAAVLQFEDRILQMDGRHILFRDDITSSVEASAGAPITIVLERAGQRMETVIQPEYVEEEDRFVVGAYFFSVVLVLELDAASPLALAGMQQSDRIIGVNGQVTGTAAAMKRAVEDALPASEIVFTVVRGELVELTVPLDSTSLADLFSDVAFEDLGSTQHAGVGEGVVVAARQFVDYIRALADVIRGVFVGQVAAGDVFTGPVGVAKVLGEGIRVSGAYFFTLLAFLSLNFGLLNLVPFPALDGSRAVFALVEWVRGKPISPQREGIIHAIGFLILIGLMLLITYKDIATLFR